MANDPITVIIDSDAIIAQGNITDAHHKIAIQISRKLEELGAKVIYPSCIVLEATTLMHRWNKKNQNMRGLAVGTLSVMADPMMIIEPVDQQIIAGAAKYYNPKATRDDTTFDCAVAAVADKYKADYIFSWDGFYKKHGFKLAKDLL